LGAPCGGIFFDRFMIQASCLVSFHPPRRRDFLPVFILSRGFGFVPLFLAHEAFTQALFCACLAHREHNCQVLIAPLAIQGLAFSLPFIFPPVFAELGSSSALPFFGRQSVPLQCSFFGPRLPRSVSRSVSAGTKSRVASVCITTAKATNLCVASLRFCSSNDSRSARQSWCGGEVFGSGVVFI
jgi:hypothetical protein